MKRTRFLWIAILACGLFCATGAALAADVTLSGYNSFKNLAAGDGGLDPNVYEVSGNLTLDSTASINCNDNATDQPPGPVAPNASACDIAISVTGNLVMNPGSAIKAENQVAGGNGGKITILVGGNVLLQSGSPAGALISSRKTAGAGDTGIAGKITIHAGNIACETNPTKGDVTVEAGAQILADGTGDAGDIEILAGRFITIDGKVSSKTATTVGRGGVIRLIACCDLRVGESGIVSSRGSDPAADLVHLEACTVVILGLVESTGPGHNDAAGGSNLCNDANHVAPAGHTFRACVEIWSGSTVLIDASGANNGQVNADTAQGGGSSGMGWIDIYANGNITILGNAAPPFAVHANTGVGGAIAGPITIKSKFGAVNATNLAVQAANDAAGGNGGSITMGAQGNATLNTATLDAHGDYVPTIAKGGTIFIQTSGSSFVLWGTGTGDVRPTGQAVPVANRGTITVSCNFVGGATFPVSAGAQSNPIVTLCASPVIPDPANTTLNARFNCQANNCGREVPLPPPFCTKAPVRAVLDPVTGRFKGNQGVDHLVRVDLGESIQDELNKAAIPGYDAAHNNDGYIIVAVSAHGDGSLGGHTNQGAEVAGNYELPFALFGCSVTMHGPPVGGDAIGHITSGATAPPPPLVLEGIFIMDLHAADGTTGWLVEGNGRYVRNTYGSTSGTGVWIKGDNNIMHNGAGSSNSGVGLKIEGSGNYVTDTDVFANGSHGVQVIGDHNQILKVDAGDKGKGNGGDGVNANGSNNTFQEIDAFANTNWGFNITGTGTGNILNKNNGGDRGKGNGAGGFQLSGSVTLLQNTAIGNGGNGFDLQTAGWNLKNNISGGTGTGQPNVGCQFNFAAAGNANQGGNKSSGVTLSGTPFAAGCK